MKSALLALHFAVVDCLTIQPHANVSQMRICSDKCTCCHTDTEDGEFGLKLAVSPRHSSLTLGKPAQALTLKRPASGDRILGHQVLSHWYDWTWEKPHRESGNRTQVCRSRGGRPYHRSNEADTPITGPTRRTPLSPVQRGGHPYYRSNTPITSPTRRTPLSPVQRGGHPYHRSNEADDPITGPMKWTPLSPVQRGGHPYHRSNEADTPITGPTRRTPLSPVQRSGRPLSPVQ